MLNQETGEPFLPFNFHLDLSLALAQLVERHLLHSSRFTSVTHHPVVNQIFLSTKLMASSAVRLLFANLGYQQFQLHSPNKIDTHRLSRDASRLRPLLNTRLSDRAARRSHSQGPPSDLVGLSSDASQSMLTWTINLLLRLHLPGCAALVPQTPPPLTMKTDLTRIWQLLLSMNLDRNPVAAFLLISLHTRLFGLTIQLSAGTHLHRLLNTVIQSQQSILILRTLNIIFHQLTACPVVPDDQLELITALVAAFQLYQREQLRPPRSQSQFLELLIGSCVDATLYQPYKCVRLIHVLLRACTQPGWCMSKDCLTLVEACLELTLWTRHNYIPGRLGSKAYLYGWFEQEDFTIIKTLLKVNAVYLMFYRYVHIFNSQSNCLLVYISISSHGNCNSQESYVQQLSTNPPGWSVQLASAGAAAATWAWSQSARVIHGFKGRILGTSNDGTTSDSEQVKDAAALPEPCFVGQYVSVLNTFWSQMPLILDTNSGPFWLLTVAHAMDWEMQGSLELLHGTSEDTGPKSQQPNGLWSLLVPILSKHVNDLATAVHHIIVISEHLAPESSISVHPLDVSLLSLLEQILIESDILPSIPSSASGPDDTVHTAILQRVRSVFLQLCVVQSVSLIEACPCDHPAFIGLIHLALKGLFSLPESSYGTATESILSTQWFPVGILLLRCLPWSIFRLPFWQPKHLLDCTSGAAVDNDRRTLLDVLYDKLKSQLVFLETTSEDEMTGQCGSIQVIQTVIHLLGNLETMISRSVFNVDQSSDALKPTLQQETVDALLDIYNWREHTRRLHSYVQLWNQHRLSTVAFEPLIPVEPPCPHDVFSRLRDRQSKEHRYNPPYCSLDELLTASVAHSLPRSVDRYPHYLDELRITLGQHTKRLCDQIERITQLQTNHRVTLVPNLYRITNVSKSEQVECKSLLPAWMTGSKRCLGGACLSCEYKTVKVNEKIDQACHENCAMVQNLFDALFEDVRSTAAAVGSKDGQSVKSISERHEWSIIGIRFECAVKQLIRLSHETGLETGQNQSIKSASHELVHDIGVRCFEQMCQNLSGSLLSFPVSKKLMAECVQQLAEEFLTSLSAGYERVLDLFVALPHLSTVLLPTFIAPTTGPCSARVKPNAPHPLLPIYERLMDIRSRCSPEVAFKILAMVNTTLWFENCEDRQTTPPPMALFHALCRCVKQTTAVSDSHAEADKDLHQLCLKHLRILLRFHLSELLSSAWASLLQDICDIHALPIWICLAELAETEVKEFGSLTLSTEKLIVLLNMTSSTFSKASTLSSSINETLCDEFIHTASADLIEAVLSLLYILLREFGVKLGCCVRAKHMTVACAAPILLEHLTNIFGTILNKCIAIEFHNLSITTSPQSAEVFSSERCLRYLVDVLRRAKEVCSIEVDPHWSLVLSDSLLFWIIRAPCAGIKLANLSHMKQSVCSPTASPLATRQKSSSPSPGSPVTLLIALCAIRANSKGIAEELRYVRELSSVSTSWNPSISTLDGIIMSLMQTRPLSNSQLTEQLVHLAVLILESVHWTDMAHWISDSFELKALYPQWADLSPTDIFPIGIRSKDHLVGFTESLVLLLVLLSQAAHNAHSKTKDLLRQIIESVSNSVHLGNVNDRCYAYILSHLVEPHMPAHCVLMPPTSMEGRLFGLLASAACMVASLEPTHITSPVPHMEHPTTSLYPSLSSSPISVVDYQPLVVLHRKRLAYVRKLINLLQCAWLRGRVPAVDLESLLSGTPDVFQSEKPVANTTKVEQTVLGRLTQPVGSLLKKFVPLTFGGVNTASGALTTKCDNNRSSRCLTVLTWLRIGNLLSELEAVAGSVASDAILSTNFKHVAELCQELINLVVQPLPRNTQDSDSTLPSYKPMGGQKHPNPFLGAVIHWFLGDLGGTLPPAVLPCSVVMPRSINAALSKPMCFTLLTLTASVNDTCLIASVRLLETVLWSLFSLAPSTIDPNERLTAVYELFQLDARQSAEELLVRSNGLVHCCLREGSLLPLLTLVHSKVLQFSDDLIGQQRILVADLLHWLNTVHLRNVVEGSLVQLNGFVLFLGFVLNTMTVTFKTESQDGPTTSSHVCCSAHPAWSVAVPDTSYQSVICPVAESVSRLLVTVSGLHKILLKLKISNQQSAAQLSRLLIFISCVGGLLEAWLGENPSRRTYFTSLKQLSNSIATSAESTNDVEYDSRSLATAILVRLPSWNLTEAFDFLFLQCWPSIRPCVKQLMSFSVKT
ncbi:hypothetical protein PHET_05708 [Paragonimus heterotremus]|uniref:Uncharacterized protein n=1 Tax=Paragonimus heterotremus TaxID=100268 RepID=A0A8J4SP26_9TREM|nr:hypothetical protein PHET_05708 [Paragonimus heterotremus]